MRWLSRFNKVDDLTLVCCRAHCRRKFYEAILVNLRKTLKLLDINSVEAMKETVISKIQEVMDRLLAQIGLAYYNKLFFTERELKELPVNEKKIKRQEKEVLIWESFWE